MGGFRIKIKGQSAPYGSTVLLGFPKFFPVRLLCVALIGILVGTLLPAEVAVAQQPSIGPNAQHHSAHNGMAVLAPTGDVPRGPDGVPLDGWAHRVALVIGNGAYKRDGMELPNPVNDAFDVAELLREGGFEVIRGLNLDRRTMITAISDFRDKLDPRGRAVFYFAGHAIEESNENYLLPIDVAEMRYIRDAPNYGVMLSNVFKQIVSQPSGAHLIVLDACRNNPLPVTTGTRSTPPPPSRLNVEVQTLPENTVVGFAVPSGGEAPDEGFNGRNGLYTETFLQVARTRGQNTRVDMLLGGVNSELRRQTAFSGETITGDLPIDLEFNLLPPPAAPQPVVFSFREAPAPGTRVFINGDEVNYDAQGRFEMASLTGKGNVRLQVQREGYEIIQDYGINVDPAHPIALPPMVPMPKPTSSFMLEVENAPPGTTVRAAGNLVPDFRGSGQYLFDKLEGDYIDYEVTAPGYEPISARMQLESGRENSKRVSLAPNRGVYLLQGITPATATVEVLGADEIRVVRGTAPGEWQLENVPTGNLRVKIDAVDHHARELEVPVVMLEAGGASRLSHPERIALAPMPPQEGALRIALGSLELTDIEKVTLYKDGEPINRGQVLPKESVASMSHPVAPGKWRVRVDSVYGNVYSQLAQEIKAGEIGDFNFAGLVERMPAKALAMTVDGPDEAKVYFDRDGKRHELRRRDNQYYFTDRNALMPGVITVHVEAEDFEPTAPQTVELKANEEVRLTPLKMARISIPVEEAPMIEAPATVASVAPEEAPMIEAPPATVASVRITSDWADAPIFRLVNGEYVQLGTLDEGAFIIKDGITPGETLALALGDKGPEDKGPGYEYFDVVPEAGIETHKRVDFGDRLQTAAAATPAVSATEEAPAAISTPAPVEAVVVTEPAKRPSGQSNNVPSRLGSGGPGSTRF